VYGRITKFTGDPARLDDAVAYLRDSVAPIVERLDGSLGMSAFVDRDAGVLGVSAAYTTPEARAASLEAIAPMRAHVAEMLGGQFRTVEVELALIDQQRPAQVGYCNRATLVLGPPERVDDGIAAFRSAVLPLLRTLPGYCSVALLVDRATGASIAATTWSSREAMEASREPLFRLRDEVIGDSGAQLLEVVETEIVLAGIRTGNQYEQIAKRVYAAFSAGGDLDDLDEIIAPEPIEHEVLPPGTPAGRDGLKAVIRSYREAFPDIRFEIEKYLEQGDLACTVVRCTGTNTGPFLGAPATGRQIDVTLVDVVRHDNGVCVEHWGVVDNLTLMQQLGMPPIPQQAPAAQSSPVEA